MTFKAAQAKLADYLVAQAWEVKTFGQQGKLKVPHATSPSGRVRLWFKPQAIHVSISPTENYPHSLGEARSLWVDVRKMRPEEVYSTLEQEYLEIL